MQTGMLLLSASAFILGDVSALLTEVRDGTCAGAGFTDLTKDECWEAADELGLERGRVVDRHLFSGGCSRHRELVSWSENSDVGAIPKAARFLICKGDLTLGNSFLASAPDMPKLPATVELPYQSEIALGDGYHHDEMEFASNPFKRVDVPIQEEPVSLDTTFTRRVIKSAHDFSSNMRATAHIDGKGWGVTARADFQMDRVETFSASEVLFVLHINKDLGFKGWKYAPPLTDAAKNHLCKNGTDFRADEFEQIYGTYYVSGSNMGSVLDIYVSFKTQTTNSDQKISASMEASWQGVGQSVSGSASFSQQVTEDKTTSDLNVFAQTSGIPRDWIPDANLTNIQELVEQYKTRSSEGSGVSLVLKRFADHPDYIAQKTLCEDGQKSVPVDEMMLELMTNLVVEAKLMYKDILNRNPTQCALEISLEVGEFIEKWGDTGILDVNAVTRNEAQKELMAIKAKWDQQENKCLKNVKNCHCLDSNDPHFGKNQFVCDGDTEETKPRYCQSDEVCYADGDFRLDNLKDGCKKVPMCHCRTPHQGTVSWNGFSCDDGTSDWCTEWQECSTTTPWKKGAQQEEACVEAHVCTCDNPHHSRQMTCWQKRAIGDGPKETRACAGDESNCDSDYEFMYGDWGAACLALENSFLATSPTSDSQDGSSSNDSDDSMFSSCTKANVSFKGKAVKLKAEDTEECFAKCQENKKMNGRTCKGWVWKAGSKKPCRLYKTKSTKTKTGVVMGKRNCHPTDGKVDKED